MMRKNMAKLVQAKSLFAQQQEAQGDPSGIGAECMEQMAIYLDMMDEIDNCLQ